jgi:hypothetical protein
MTAIDTDKASIPSTIRLEQNFPNPFNPNTVINYQVSANNHVTLKVFDLLGREVATLVTQEKPAGNYSVEFNGSNLSSGIYYYQMKAGNFVDTKKMMLVK